MRKIIIIAILLAVLGSADLRAQNDYRKTFDEFTFQARQRHSSFTDTVNVIFAKSIGEGWIKYELSEGDSRQPIPEPEYLPTAVESQSTFSVVTISEAIDTIPPRWPLETDTSLWSPQSLADKHNSRIVKFYFYDTEQIVTVPREYGSFHPKGISETDVANFWVELSRYDYKFILADCAKYTELWGNNDWAILEWVQSLSGIVFPRNINSERTIFTVFLLNQMGLMTKIARADEQLISLFSSMQPVYARKFITVNTYPFYLAEKSISASEIFTYNSDFMKPARPLDLRIKSSPKFGSSYSYVISQKRSDIFNSTLDLPVNQALLRFYANYPQTLISVYATAEPDTRFSSALIAGMRNGLSGLSEIDAVNKLLAFLQMDFSYQTDIAQFGFEKPFFAEENFVHPCNDCEDRAAMFAYLVRTMLGRKVVLLEYPDHVSAAVCLNGTYKGDYLNVREEKYYVCDPSYIGATLGMTMPKYKNISVKVYAL